MSVNTEKRLMNKEVHYGEKLDKKHERKSKCRGRARKLRHLIRLNVVQPLKMSLIGNTGTCSCATLRVKWQHNFTNNFHSNKLKQKRVEAGYKTVYTIIPTS